MRYVCGIELQPAAEIRIVIDPVHGQRCMQSAPRPSLLPLLLFSLSLSDSSKISDSDHDVPRITRAPQKDEGKGRGEREREEEEANPRSRARPRSDGCPPIPDRAVISGSPPEAPDRTAPRPSSIPLVQRNISYHLVSYAYAHDKRPKRKEERERGDWGRKGTRTQNSSIRPHALIHYLPPSSPFFLFFQKKKTPQQT